MELSIFEIVTENNCVCSRKEQWKNLLPEIKRIYNQYSYAAVIFGQQAFQAIGDHIPTSRKIIIAEDILFGQDVELVTDIASALELVIDTSNVLVLGAEMYMNFPSQAVRLYLVKLHTEEKYCYPQVKFVGWSETERKLHWAEGEKNPEYSLIEYGRNGCMPELSVIISTYNQPIWLEKVMYGYEYQHFRNFEVIIADDGSSKETLDMIERIRPRLSYRIKHVWHADNGFRKCVILNKAIKATASDYLLFSDGDCIPRNDFLDKHLKYRKIGRFLSGGYHKLSMDISLAIADEDIYTGNCFDVMWLKFHGMKSSFKNNKLTSHGKKEWLLNTFTTAKATWNGHNASGWKKDILAVNGFDERMEYGAEDREMGERLMNAGIGTKQIRYSAITVHLDHDRGYVRQEALDRNKAIRKDTAAYKRRWTEYGIIKSGL